jgi:hypothetical protein
MMTTRPPFTRRARSFVQDAWMVGLVAAGAATGMLMGFGQRTGRMWRPLNAAAHMLIGARADGVWNFQGSVTPLGAVVVLTSSLVAGLIVARLASSGRTLHVVAVGAGVALSGYLVHLHVVGRMPGGLTELLSRGELRALYCVTAVALVSGMRFAFSRGRAHGD